METPFEEICCRSIGRTEKQRTYSNAVTWFGKAAIGGQMSRHRAKYRPDLARRSGPTSAGRPAG